MEIVEILIRGPQGTLKEAMATAAVDQFMMHKGMDYRDLAEGDVLYLLHLGKPKRIRAMIALDVASQMEMDALRSAVRDSFTNLEILVAVTVDQDIKI